MTPAQCRAARALVNISQEALAEAAKVGVSTVRDFEAERRKARAASLALIQGAFERMRIVFIEENGGGAGVRLKKPKR